MARLRALVSLSLAGAAVTSSRPPLPPWSAPFIHSRPTDCVAQSVESTERERENGDWRWCSREQKETSQFALSIQFTNKHIHIVRALLALPWLLLLLAARIDGIGGRFVGVVVGAVVVVVVANVVEAT